MKNSGKKQKVVKRSYVKQFVVLYDYAESMNVVEDVALYTFKQRTKVKESQLMMNYWNKIQQAIIRVIICAANFYLVVYIDAKMLVIEVNALHAYKHHSMR